MVLSVVWAQWCIQKIEIKIGLCYPSIIMKNTLYIIIALLVLSGIVWLIVTPGKSGAPSKLDTFAQCIKQSGATFYGAFWCPHCQAQKAMFGNSVKYLPYVECSNPDGQTQTQVCINAGIISYPTWEFPQPGTSTPKRVEGVIELADLASSTSCVLPQ